MTQSGRLPDLEALAKLMASHKLLEVTLGDVRVVMSPTAFLAPPQAAAPVPTGNVDELPPADEELLYRSSGLETFDPEADETQENIRTNNPFVKWAP